MGWAGLAIWAAACVAQLHAGPPGAGAPEPLPTAPRPAGWRLLAALRGGPTPAGTAISGSGNPEFLECFGHCDCDIEVFIKRTNLFLSSIHCFL